MSLSQFRGKVVMLSFEDSECTTVCPLTTQSMLEAKQLLGAAGDKVQLLGVDANPDATSVADVLAYSRAHGMVNQWDFLTGSLPQLKAPVARLQHRRADRAGTDRPHSRPVRDRSARPGAQALPDPDGLLQRRPVRAGARRRDRSLLPGHPHVASQQSLASITVQGPADHVTLPSALKRRHRRPGTWVAAPGHVLRHLAVRGL
jgi:hypothetical protein